MKQIGVTNGGCIQLLQRPPFNARGYQQFHPHAQGFAKLKKGWTMANAPLRLNKGTSSRAKFPELVHVDDSKNQTRWLATRWLANPLVNPMYK